MKSYLRYVPTEAFAVIASSQSTDLLIGQQGKVAITPALEDVCAFNLRQATKIQTMRPPGPTLDNPEADVPNVGEVTSLALAPDGKTVAAGYSSGIINLFDLSTGMLNVTLHGHHSAVSCLEFSQAGSILASGGRDNDLILWDVITESGMYRLKGHKDGVNGIKLLETSSPPTGNPTHVVSISKDALAKVWDLSTQHCIQTLTGHRSEIWSIDLSPDGRRMITGAADRQLRVWSITDGSSITANDEGEEQGKEKQANGGVGVGVGGMNGFHSQEGEGEMKEDQVAVYMGSVLRESNDRCLNVRYDNKGQVLAAQDAGRLVDIYRVRNEAEARKKMKRRMKRAREKERQKQTKAVAGGADEGGAWGLPTITTNAATKGGAAATGEEAADKHDGEEGDTLERLAASDELEWILTLRATHRIRGIVFVPETSGTAIGGTAAGGSHQSRLLLSLANNALEIYGIGLDASKKEYNKIWTLDSPGHRSDIRALALSSDDSMIASTCSSQLKVWNRTRQSCLRTTPLGFGLCLAFLPGDRHIVVGTKEGKLHLIDLATGDILETHEDAHGGAIWSLDVRPDGKALVTGSADHEVKCWELELSETGRLGLVHTRTLKLADDVLAVRYSRTRDPDKLLLAVALLDSTVKVFYENSLRFFLSLYGHKLPVMAMDISEDNEIIATASADKTVKIWGLDFGDCHRSLLAHADSVMGLRFVPGTHCFFTCSKDKTIKYWDADHFEHILTMPGHQAEVWGLAMSSDGSFFTSCSHDRSIRLWERSDDQVYLEEERNRELEAMFESELDKDPRGGSGQQQLQLQNSEAAAVENGPGGEESALASRRSIESVKNAERLGEALDVAAADEAAGEELGPNRPPNPLMLGLSAPRYILFHLRLVKGPDLEQALLVLTLDAIQRLLRHLTELLQEGLEVELCWRCIVFLLRIHHAQIMNSRELVSVLAKLREELRERLRAHRDAIGVNVAGLRLLKREMESSKNAYVIEEGEGGGLCTLSKGAKKAKK